MKIHTALILMHGEDQFCDDSIEGAAPTPKNSRCAQEEGLNASLHSGLYPTHKGIEGPVKRFNSGLVVFAS